MPLMRLANIYPWWVLRFGGTGRTLTALVGFWKNARGGRYPLLAVKDRPLRAANEVHEGKRTLRFLTPLLGLVGVRPWWA